MGYHKNGRSSVVDFLQELHNLHGVSRVQVSGRLVRQKNVRPVDNGSCHGNSLLLSSGKLLREGFVLLCQSDQRQNFRHALFDDAVRFLDDTLCECYVFIDIPVF